MRRFSIYILILIAISSCGKKTQETKPIRNDITETVYATGILEAEGTYQLTAQVDGYLTNVNFEEGDIITIGKILAVIDNKNNEINAQSASELLQIARANTDSRAPSLAQAKQSIEIAKNKMEQDELQASRYQDLWKNNSVAKIDYENAVLNAKTSKSNYETALENYKRIAQDAKQQLINSQAATKINSVAKLNNQIVAIVPGRIYKKYKEAGDYIKKGEILATIGNAQVIYAKVNIDESSIAKIKIGQEAVIQLNTNKEKNYHGKVYEIAPEFNEASQSFICKIAFTDSLDFRIANTQLQCNIITNTQKSALLIPKNYFNQAGSVQVKGETSRRTIKTGIVSSEWVQVLGGIDENTVLVTDDLASNQIKTSEIGVQMK